ncbi:hypothetical protein I4U23_002212 [Adineta vaga]|nr:hypothetical protein I4U23_002212 [Adineta vaga]
MKSVIIIAIVLLGCVAYNEALQCYSHDVCAANCPQLANTIKTCASDETKCYKLAAVAGVSRGCGKDRCNFQADVASNLANVCCEGNLCNSAITSKIALSTIFMVLGAFLFARM